MTTKYVGDIMCGSDLFFKITMYKEGAMRAFFTGFGLALSALVTIVIFNPLGFRIEREKAYNYENQVYFTGIGTTEASSTDGENGVLYFYAPENNKALNPRGILYVLFYLNNYNKLTLHIDPALPNNVAGIISNRSTCYDNPHPLRFERCQLKSIEILVQSRHYKELLIKYLDKVRLCQDTIVKKHGWTQKWAPECHSNWVAN